MDPNTILAEWPSDCQPRRIEFLDTAGGFSGARFWRIAAPAADLCLRRWPAEHPTETGLGYIHGVLLRAAVAGLSWVATPLPTRDGRTWVERGGHFWELTRWMPGRADYHRRPTPGRLRAALAALATFHRAVADSPDEPPQRAVSPGIAARRALLDGWRHGGLEVLEESLDDGGYAEILPLARRILPLASRAAAGVAAALAEVQDVELPLQPCICDVWHDHVLFQGETVTGLIDFGAMRPEHVASDVARLLGSLVGDDAEGWRVGLEGYAAVRPLGSVDLTLAAAFDRSTVLMAGLNWIDWLFKQRREFPDLGAVRRRLGEIVVRLERLDAHGAHPAMNLPGGGLGTLLQLP